MIFISRLPAIGDGYRHLGQISQVRMSYGDERPRGQSVHLSAFSKQHRLSGDPHRVPRVHRLIRASAHRDRGLRTTTVKISSSEPSTPVTPKPDLAKP